MGNTPLLQRNEHLETPHLPIHLNAQRINGLLLYKEEPGYHDNLLISMKDYYNYVISTHIVIKHQLLMHSCMFDHTHKSVIQHHSCIAAVYLL